MPHKDPVARRAYLKRWRDRRGEHHRKYMQNYGRWHRTGWTPEQMADAMKAQDGRCAICKDVLGTPVPDHCHATNRTRGVLCRQCNMGLGMFADNPETLLAAAAYLELHNAHRQS